MTYIMKNIQNFKAFNEDIQPQISNSNYTINNSKDLRNALLAESKKDIKNSIYANFRVDILTDNQVKVMMTLKNGDEALITGSISIEKPFLKVVLNVSSLINGDNKVEKKVKTVQEFFELVRNVAASA